MKVAEVMTRHVVLVHPNQTVRDAALQMSAEDVGALPVGENDRLVGMVTDRDIAVRCVAEGKGPDTRLRAIMTEEIKFCFEDDEAEDVARDMAELQVRRLPVLNEDRRLVGIVSLADFARTSRGRKHVVQAMSGIAQPHSH